MTTVKPTAERAAYPMPRPDHDDPRFSIGLLVDVTAALARHGYPPVRSGTDAPHSQQRRFHTIYRDQP